MKKNKQKLVNDKKLIDPKKRKTPEKILSSDNPAANTRSTPKPIKENPKTTFSNMPDKNVLPMAVGKNSFKLKRTQNFLKKLINQNSTSILAKKVKIEESLKEILDENLTVDQLKISKIGVDLQKFANACSKISSLMEIQKSIQTVLNKLKEEAILSLFGSEESSSPKADSSKKMEDSESIHDNSLKEEKKLEEQKEVEEKMEEKIEEGQKIPQDGQCKRLCEQICEEPEERKQESMPEQITLPTTQSKDTENKPLSTSSKEVVMGIKEPAIMLIVCKEIADVLKKVFK